ncbi:hypothetical protein [Acrocarpospora sp. B8E8]|uniref:hypothetical protein n=1 Tax=Acrocarpospora sp. B8E8 TaxID=3153572 RepID=UPI00325D168C
MTTANTRIPPSNEVSAPPSLTAAEAAELLQARLREHGMKAEVTANDGAARLWICPDLIVWAYPHGYSWQNGVAQGKPVQKGAVDPGEAAALLAARFKELTGVKPTVPERRPPHPLSSAPPSGPPPRPPQYPQPTQDPHSDAWTNSPWS